MSLRQQLRQDGYLLLRQAIPSEWLDDLRAAFDAGARPSHEWPIPRGRDWCHSLLDRHPRIQALCRLPVLLAATGAIIDERFFLSHVEGREPLAGGGHQRLHRDMWGHRPGDTVTAMAYFDDYGPHNGATRLIPGSHRFEPGETPFDFDDESRCVQVCGSAGDILVFDVDLVHGASLNPSGARRRSILINYCSEPLYDTHLRTAPMRNVSMDSSERFEPADYDFVA